MVNFIKWITVLLLLPISVVSQEIRQLDLSQAYSLSQRNYPVIRQKDLVRQTAEINIENLSKGFLPQFNVSAQATYQSDVTRVEVPLPGLNIESPSRDQYKLVADLSQLIYDGGITREQKEFQHLNAVVEEQKAEVELYNLKERINQLFLGALYLGEQLNQVELVKADIQTGIDRVDAQVKNGVAFRSNLNMLKAELLKADQRSVEIRATRTGLLDALSLFLGAKIDENVVLIKPVSAPVPIDDEIRRPEVKLFTEQARLVKQQERLINAKNLPKASLFAQGGYGKPGLNMLKNEFDFYYIGGIRVNWSLAGLYTRKKEKELVEVNRKLVDIQKETFLLNTSSQLKQQQAEIDKLLKLIASDYEIIELRRSVKEAAKSQLENGVITANDYLKEINAEDQARQTLITHEVQLLQAQINYRTLAGNQ